MSDIEFLIEANTQDIVKMIIEDTGYIKTKSVKYSIPALTILAISTK